MAQEGGFTFGIRPTKAFEDRPESFSYFSFILEPGARIEDEALVLNMGDQPITLKLYVADGLTAQNGGTSFTAQGELSPGGSRGVSSWITLPVNEVTLGPEEERTVPFVLAVPEDAPPGHHIAGLVVEAEPGSASAGDSNEGDAQFAVEVIHRVGVAVVIDVPGPRMPGLSIEGLDFVGQGEQGASFSMLLHNTGNILIDGEGVLSILTTAGEELGSYPVAFDTILPGDAAKFNLLLPISLSDSDYLANLTLRYGEGAYASLENVEIRVRGGGPDTGEQVGEAAGGPEIVNLGPRAGDFSLASWVRANRGAAAAIFFVLITGLVAFNVLIWRRFLRDRNRG